MNIEQKQIVDFMVKARQNTPLHPTIPNTKTRRLRINLIAEELLELVEAYGLEMEIVDDSKGHGPPTVHVTEGSDVVSLKDAYDAVLDLLVVVIGTAVAMGTLIDPGWEEVHRSNMSKFIDGHLREDGKWQKGPSYSPADLEPIIQRLLAAGGLTEPLREPDE